MRSIATILLLLLAVSVCPAATWHVAKDGSGDFTVIQDAIDAASPGDEIWIHAGRYDELITDYDIWGDDTVIADVHVAITKDDLTLRGDGADATIIGPATYPSDPVENYVAITVTSTQANSLTIHDLAVENVNYGMYVACPSFAITASRFEGNLQDGIRLFTDGGSTITDCEFVDTGHGVFSFSPTENLTITGSEFSDVRFGCVCINSDNVTISDCEYTGGRGAIDFQQGTTGVVSGVTAVGFEILGMNLSMGAYAEIRDSRFEGGVSGVLSDGEGLVCEGTAFVGQTYQAVFVSTYPGISVFHDCDIINGGGWSVYCEYNATDDCHVDMTNCYWGTDSEAQIAEWIWDSNDDPDLCCTVDFIPFDGPVATEPRSWSAVKGLFGIEE